MRADRTRRPRSWACVGVWDQFHSLPGALQRGFLSGRYKKGDTIPEDTATQRYNKPTFDRMSTEENHAILE